MDPQQQVPLCSPGQVTLLGSSCEVQGEQNSVCALLLRMVSLAGCRAVARVPWLEVQLWFPGLLVISRESWGSIQISEHAEIILASDSSPWELGRPEQGWVKAGGPQQC